MLPVVYIAVGMAAAAVVWVLSEPSRKVPRGYYGKSRRFLITGCASGMGKHLAEVLVRQGHRVCAADVRFKEIDVAGAKAVKLDVTKPEEWEKVLGWCEEEWGGLDVVMNVAGCLAPHRIQDATVSEINLQIDVNVKGVIFGTKYGAALMQRQRKEEDFHGGHIVNFSSMAATGVVSGVTIYAASKFACRGFSLAANKDLYSRTGIAVTCFMPDAVQTPMVDLQLHFEEAAMAFSGDILSVEDVEKSILYDVLRNRPAEVWLSSRKHVARFGDIFGSSRAVLWAEAAMKAKGIKRQQEILSTSSKQGRSNVLLCLCALFFAIYLAVSPALSVYKGEPSADAIAAKYSSHFTGKTFIVTGGTSGIGKATVEALAQHGARVVVGSRSDPMIPGVSFEKLDLSSFESIRTFNHKIVQRGITVDGGIICNAGYLSPTYTVSQDGIEQTLQVNHLGNIELVLGLNSTLIPSSRIVFVSSWWGAVYADPLDDVVEYTAENYPLFGLNAYGTSKMANVRFARELARVWSAKVYIIHPGMIATKLATKRGSTLDALFEQYGSAFFWRLIAPGTKTVGQGAATQVYCAVAPELASASGNFYDSCAEHDQPDGFVNRTIDQQIWNKSLSLINNAPYAPESKAFVKDGGWLSSLNTPHLATRTAYLVFAHVTSYVVLFSLASTLFQGAKILHLQKINPKPSGRKREKMRTIASAVIDALYCVIIETYGRVDDEANADLLLPGLLIAVWTDLHFYVTHRLLHLPALFRLAHYAHHESTNPGPWSSLSFHPIEGIVFFSAYLLVLFMPISVELWWGFKAGMVVGPLLAHCGYDFGLIQTPRHHYLHHRYKTGNFGGWPSGLWDKLFRTELQRYKDGAS